MSSRQPDFPADGAPIPAVTRPGLLYVAGPPEVSIKPLTQKLEQAGIARQSAGPDHHSFQWQPVTDGGLHHIEPHLKERADAHLLLFYQAPAIVLAESMGNDCSPDDALADWLESIEAMLAVVRQNRRRITLVEMTLAQQHPASLLDRLNQRLSLSLSKWQGGAASQPKELDPVHLLIAQNAVLTNTNARRLASELQATALPIGNESSLLPDSLSAWNTYNQGIKMAEARPVQANEFEELKEENELLLLQLHQVQEELESYYLTNLDLEKKTSKQSKLEKENRVLQQRAQVLSQKIDNMRQSKSWKITKPLRGFTKLFKRNRNKQA